MTKPHEIENALDVAGDAVAVAKSVIEEATSEVIEEKTEAAEIAEMLIKGSAEAAALSNNAQLEKDMSECRSSISSLEANQSEIAATLIEMATRLDLLQSLITPAITPETTPNPAPVESTSPALPDPVPVTAPTPEPSSDQKPESRAKRYRWI